MFLVFHGNPEENGIVPNVNRRSRAVVKKVAVSVSWQKLHFTTAQFRQHSVVLILHGVETAAPVFLRVLATTGLLLSNVMKRKQQAPLFPEPPSSPPTPFKVVLHEWFVNFNKYRGGRYQFSSRDGKAIKQLLAREPVNVVVEIIRRTLAQTDGQSRWFCTRVVNLYDVERWWMKIRNELGMTPRPRTNAQLSQDCGNRSMSFAP